MVTPNSRESVARTNCSRNRLPETGCQAARSPGAHSKTAGVSVLGASIATRRPSVSRGRLTIRRTGSRGNAAFRLSQVSPASADFQTPVAEETTTSSGTPGRTAASLMGPPRREVCFHCVRLRQLRPLSSVRQR